MRTNSAPSATGTGPAAHRWRTLQSPADVAAAAERLAAGEIVACGFGNFYALVTAPDEAAVRHVNAVKGRPVTQVGSITTTRDRIGACFDWSQIGDARLAGRLRLLLAACFARGPFGVRGPAARCVPAHLTQFDAGVRTTQVIAPGGDCPSNTFFAAALRRTGGDVLAITSANRSRHLTGAAEEPAHWTAAGIAAEFADRVTILAHGDEELARSRYPGFRTTSVTLLSFHGVGRLAVGLPTLTIDRHGSLDVDAVDRIARPLGFALELAPTAGPRLEPRSYA